MLRKDMKDYRYEKVFVCDGCGEFYKYDEIWSGQAVVCGKCKSDFNALGVFMPVERKSKLELLSQKLINSPVLLIATICCVVHVYTMVVGQYPILDMGALSTVHTYEVWRIFTSGFLHGSLMHLLFNMIALVSFGKVLERMLGVKEFVGFYLFSLLITGVFWIFVRSLSDAQLYSIGASGAVCAVVMLVGLNQPDSKMFFIVFPMKMKSFLKLFTLGTLAMVIFMPDSSIDNVGHLGGLLSGYLYFKYSGLVQKWN